MNKADVIGVHALRDERDRALREIRAAENDRDAKRDAAARLARESLAFPAAAVAILEYHNARCAAAFKRGEARGIEIALLALGDKSAPNLKQLGLIAAEEQTDMADQADAGAVDIAAGEREAAFDSAA